ncbi:serine hydrolase [uncultured Brevibacillus sp.]|uniref:serine hydrolase n=1 Tax=uncultured Brevibacillus sp. TaxID=169970 RepID=UPI00259313A3|nr:serine hydrolase [uncultured Brevibacillus sp.]
MKTRQQRFEHLFGELASKQLISGTVLAAENGQIIYQAAFGDADLTTGRKLTTGSVFELASLSKPITAMGMVHLMERGKLSFDDLIAKWIPELPYQGITIRHLLCHTSGLPEYMNLFFDHWDRRKIATNQDVLDMLIQHQPPVFFAPNERWLYSNTGYIMLAIIIERVTGKSFASFMKQHLFAPLKMNRTLVYNRRLKRELIEDYAYGYVYDLFADRFELPDLVTDTEFVFFLDGMQGDGAVNSNLQDLLRFDQALYSGELVSQQTLEEVFSPVRLNNGESINYGLGWRLEQSVEKGRIMSHPGRWSGYKTILNHYHDHRRTLIYLRNKEQDVDFEEAIILAAENILFDLPYEIPAAPKEKKLAKIDPALYDSYVGTYLLENEEGMAAVIETEEGRLFLKVTGKVRDGLYPASDTRFFVSTGPVEVEFLKDETGRVNKIILFLNGEERQAQRL